MKSLLRNTTFYTITLYLITLIFSGITVSGGLTDYVVSGLVLAILFSILKPIFGLVSLPLNLVTFGLFSFFTNAIILYLTTIIVPNISISAFVFKGLSWGGFIIPSFSFNILFAYVVCAGALSIIMSYFGWLLKK